MTSKEEISSIFDQFKQKKVFIIGDIMLDHYIVGKASRISPEAPVPVVDVKTRTSRLGGAANVALNIRSLGATPTLFAVVGNDFAKNEITELLSQNNITDSGIIIDNSRPTTVKNRVISYQQQLLRFDEETTSFLDKDVEDILLSTIKESILKEQPDVIIFEDYDKGVITHKIIEEVTQLANQNNIPTIVDPKKRSFLEYKNVTLFKPNLRELEEGLNLSIDKKNIEDISKAVNKLREILSFKEALITLSENGIYFDSKDTAIYVKAHLRNISDVSGAGDTVVSVAALCLACHISSKLLTEISNIAGGLVCEKSGVVSVDINELKNESIKLLC